MTVSASWLSKTPPSVIAGQTASRGLFHLVPSDATQGRSSRLFSDAHVHGFLPLQLYRLFSFDLYTLRTQLVWMSFFKTFCSDLERSSCKVACIPQAKRKVNKTRDICFLMGQCVSERDKNRECYKTGSYSNCSVLIFTRQSMFFYITI